MTLLEYLKAQLAAGTATITEPVGLVGSDYSIAMVYFKPTPVVVEPPVEEPPPVVVDPPPLPVVVNLIEGSEAGSTSKSLTIPFVAGKTYTVSLDVVGSAVGRFELFTRTLKGKTSVAKQSGPGRLNYVFAPKAADVGLFLDVKYGARWENALLVEGGTVVPPVVIEPPPVVDPPPPVVVDPPPVVEPPPVVTPPPANGRASIGLNLSNAEMGGTVPGILNKDYAYPTNAYLDWVISTGVEEVRLAFKWRRLVTGTTATGLKSSDLPHIRRIVSYLNAKGIRVILNMHDYGKYQGNPIGHPSTPIEFYAFSWGLFAEEFKNDNVVFGLMNEPNGQDYRLMAKGINAAIAAIRAKGAKQRILVPGMNWSGAHSFVKSSAPIFEEIPVVDPENNWAFEVHQYLDSDSSGTHAEVVTDKGAKVLADVTEWCRARGFKLFLGEHGVGRDAASLKEMRDMLTYLHANADVWVGHTYWAAGAWWKESYIRAIGPDKTNEQLHLMMEFAQ